MTVCLLIRCYKPSLHGIILAQSVEFCVSKPAESRLLTIISVLNYLNK